MIGSTKAVDVAIIHRYFWPQNYPYASMLKSIAEGLVEAGLAVAVYGAHEPGTDQARLRKQWATEIGASVHSIPLVSERKFGLLKKVLSASIYAIWVFLVAVSCRAKVIWVGSTPPIVMVAVLRVARVFRRFKIIYHCQDIHPEGLAVNGNIRSQNLLKALQKIDSANVRSSDAVITLSEDMRRTLAERPCDTTNVHIINNFILEDISVSQVSPREIGVTRFLFAGSLGRFQNLLFLTQVAVLLARRHGVRTTFMGDGPVRNDMEHIVNKAGMQRFVTFTGHKSLEEAVAAMHGSDFGLVSLAPGVDRVAYPSKTVMYLAAGLPCIAFVDPSSSLGEMVREERLGTAVAPGSPAEAAGKVQDFLRDGAASVLGRRDIAAFAEMHFSRETVVSRMVELVLRVAR